MIAPKYHPALKAPAPATEPAEPRTYVIRSEKHNAWYRADCAGYAGSLVNAGHYTAAEANRLCAGEAYLQPQALADYAWWFRREIVRLDAERAEVVKLLALCRRRDRSAEGRAHCHGQGG